METSELKRIMDRDRGDVDREIVEINGWVAVIFETGDGWEWAVMPPGERRFDGDGFIVGDISRTRWGTGGESREAAMTEVRRFVEDEGALDVHDEVRRYDREDPIEFLGWTIRAAHSQTHGWQASATNERGERIWTQEWWSRDRAVMVMRSIIRGRRMREAHEW